MGSPSFLLVKKQKNFCRKVLCQCPERGDLHFYFTVSDGEMAFSGLCQCPERGNLHFYALIVALVMALCCNVSMPWKGRPSFLPSCEKVTIHICWCVNALKGATFISTLASWNPCKSRLCGSIFPEVFQNILKKAFLNGVFWKFTICSYLTVPFLLLVYLFFLGLRST